MGDEQEKWKRRGEAEKEKDRREEEEGDEGCRRKEWRKALVLNLEWTELKCRSKSVINYPQEVANQKVLSHLKGARFSNFLHQWKWGLTSRLTSVTET